MAATEAIVRDTATEAVATSASANASISAVDCAAASKDAKVQVTVSPTAENITVPVTLEDAPEFSNSWHANVDAKDQITVTKESPVLLEARAYLTFQMSHLLR